MRFVEICDKKYSSKELDRDIKSISLCLFTIIQTTKADGSVVDKYLKYASESIGKGSIEDLLPLSENYLNTYQLNSILNS